MTAPITQLVYVSRASGPVSEHTLSAIRNVAMRHNPEIGVTGVLLYASGRFLQLIEGPPGQIAVLFEAIRRDPRHADIATLLSRTASRRFAGSWSMGVLNLQRFDPGIEQAIERLLGTGDHAAGPRSRLSDDDADAFISAMTRVFERHGNAAA